MEYMESKPQALHPNNQPSHTFLRQLRHIPTFGGPAFPILSYIGTYSYIKNPQRLLQEGYDKVYTLFSALYSSFAGMLTKT